MADGLAVIGAGFGRTGTLSLKQGLERLGFDACYHMAEVATHPEHADLWLRAWHGEDVWDTLFAGYRAAVDWPAAAFWPRLMERYPDAKVLLSLRDSESWFKSSSSTIFQSMEHARRSPDERLRTRLKMANEIIREGTFGSRLMDRDHAIAIYEANVVKVRAEVPADRLIEFQASDGWKGLCEPLGLPEPNEPYPWVNTSEEFLDRWRNRPDPSK
ncbi:MAG: sulfotransferase family protein [Gammaproteobacteria bacterium]|nr:sulfotransferase family protein [Gammaproteobacteria bacterium]MXY53430.1 sulfotransferase family protein [Gammaproteobacteria bacterium]MYB35901.1 sulfotransferase family protein [Gammaproteobacteria bacterium]